MCWDKCPLQLRGRKHVLNLHNSNLPCFQATKQVWKGSPFLLMGWMLHLHPWGVAVLLLLQPVLTQGRQHLCPTHPGAVGRRHPQRSCPGHSWAASIELMEPNTQPKGIDMFTCKWLRTTACISGRWPRGRWDPRQGCPVPGAPPAPPQWRLCPTTTPVPTKAEDAAAAPDAQSCSPMGQQCSAFRTRCSLPSHPHYNPSRIPAPSSPLSRTSHSLPLCHLKQTIYLWLNYKCLSPVKSYN